MRTVVIDDSRLMHEAFREVLEPDGFEIVATARAGNEVIPRVRDVHPDVVLLDLSLQGVDAIDVIQRLRRQHPDVVAVVLADADEPTDVADALAAGASAFISKSVDPQLLGATIRRAIVAPIPDPVGFSAADRESLAAGLTAREAEILQLLAAGGSNLGIGEALSVSEQTVKFHLTNIYKKLRASNRTQAVTEAHKLGIIQRDRARSATRRRPPGGSGSRANGAAPESN
ncbi:MAG TPA: response regulator transcription factor [Gaiellaceae bacterium]